MTTPRDESPLGGYPGFTRLADIADPDALLGEIIKQARTVERLGLQGCPDEIKATMGRLANAVECVRSTALQTSADGGVDEGAAWSFLRRVLSQGGDIYLDHLNKSSEAYSVRLDCAASERVPQLQALVRSAPGLRGGGVTEEMVTRFLGWKLPKDFMPDAGISFTPTPHQNGEYGPAEPHWPIGTNLLNYPQARAMLEYVLAKHDGGEG